MRECFEEIVKRLSEEIKTFYADRLVSPIIFGSVARGTDTVDPDIDLLIIATNLP